MPTVTICSTEVLRQQPPISTNTTDAYLEYLPSEEQYVRRVALHSFPFRLGRMSAAHFVVPSGQISRLHAEIYRRPDGLRIRDLGSTNGTFLNGRRIQDAELAHGDIINLAHQELRFLMEDEEETNLDRTAHVQGDLPLSVFYNLPLLDDLIERRLVRTLFQPIVTLGSQAIIGYEALGRGTSGKLSARPGDLFKLAERCQRASELSRLLRAVAVTEACTLPGHPALFLNTHPAELGDPLLVPSMHQLRDAVPADQALVLEVHEDTVTDLPALRQLHEHLRELNIGLAFDDFGVGQSRLEELADVRPDFVKLDMALVRNLHQSAQRQILVQGIVRVALDLGVQVLAEGIESEDEAKVCRQLGCSFGQGFLLGHPQAAPAPSDLFDTLAVEWGPRKPTSPGAAGCKGTRRVRTAAARPAPPGASADPAIGPHQAPPRRHPRPAPGR
jgi:EAL domain-containing protein (putative c-di-GMP-specific phosphodiesterase class I)